MAAALANKASALERIGISVADAPKKISGVHKRCWKYIPNLMKTIENSPKPETQAA